MPQKKRKTKSSKAVHHRSPKESKNDHRAEKQQLPSTSSLAAAALAGIALALGWAHISNKRTASLSSEDMLLKMVRRSPSFELSNKGSRVLSATNLIRAGTVLMEIPRELMIWDLDAARDNFVQKELFSAPFLSAETTDTMSKRAIILAAYLALLRKEVVSPSGEFPLQTLVAQTLPSYEDYASFHPVVVDLETIREYLGEHSIAYLHLDHVREKLTREYDQLSASSRNFAQQVSREEYLACRLAVQSRAFQGKQLTELDLPEDEREYYRKTIGIDFSNFVSMEPVNDFMNAHVNNNVKVSDYDPVTRTGKARAVKDILDGQELINSYGKFYDFVLFGQYGFVPTDGTGTSIASMFVHHDIHLMSEIVGEANSVLPPLGKMMPYLRYDYGYSDCIVKETNPEAFELKRLKLEYLKETAIDASRWVLPLPPRAVSDTTPMSTTRLPDDYKVPSFDPDIFEYLDENALMLALPCRLITLTDGDVDNASTLLKQDLETLRESASPHHTPVLRLEELVVSPSWMIRTVHCMKSLATAQMRKFTKSAKELEDHIMSMVENNVTNTLEWNAAHVRLEEMQSQEALETWALSFWDSVSQMVETESPDEFIRDEPCPEKHTAELIVASGA